MSMRSDQRDSRDERTDASLPARPCYICGQTVGLTEGTFVAAHKPSDAPNRALAYDEYRALRARMSVAQWERVTAKARWEQMTPWAVLNEWPSLRIEVLHAD